MNVVLSILGVAGRVALFALLALSGNAATATCLLTGYELVAEDDDEDAVEE